MAHFRSWRVWFALCLCAGWSAALSQAQPVRLDGQVNEWAPDSAAQADGRHLFVRAQVEASGHPLQASPETLSLWLDLDADAGSGEQRTDPPEASALGVDLVVEFSPARKGYGVDCRAISSDGAAHERIGHAELGLEFAPTFAAPWYEIRLSRAGDHPALAPLRRPGAVRGLFVLRDAAGEIVGWSDPFEAMLPAFAPPAEVEQLPPPAARDSVRVVSWNVLRASPENAPEPFARVLQVLAPDVIVVQEWTNEGPEQLRDWATAMLGTSADSPDLTAWHAVASEAWGVGVLSRHPLEPVGALLLLPGERSPVRFVAAVARTDRGPVLVGSVHLKCCGGAAGEEEAQRLAEADAINASVRAVLQAHGPMPVVIAGDFNLVGTRFPLERLGAGLGSRGADLRPAEAWMLGDATLRTWRDDGSDFTPGRLDYALTDRAPTAAFVFDSAPLTEAALARLGLDRSDTAASDHLPLVVDVRP